MTTKTDKISSDLLGNLSQSFKAMHKARSETSDAMKADQAEYTVFVPNYGTSDKDALSDAAREEAIVSICQIYKAAEPAKNAGLVCASEETVECIRALNSAKKTFKASVMAIRKALEKEPKIPGKHISSLITEKIRSEHGFRTDEMHQAMRTTETSELDLKKCYAEIRIMPKDLDVFCWTWATRHSRLRQVSLNDVEKKIELYFQGNDDAIEINKRFLNNCRPGEILVEKTKLKNQLRANYGYKVNNEIVRDSCPISGMVIVQGKQLPRYVWRDDPDITGIKTPQVSRLSTIEAKPLIEKLGIYRYVQ